MHERNDLHLLGSTDPPSSLSLADSSRSRALGVAGLRKSRQVVRAAAQASRKFLQYHIYN